MQACWDNLNQLQDQLSSKNFAQVAKSIDSLLDDKANKSIREWNLISERLLSTLLVYEELLEICEYLIDRVWVSAFGGAPKSLISTFFDGIVAHLEVWKLERFCFRIVEKLQNDCVEASCIFDSFCKALSKLENSSSITKSMVKSMCDRRISCKNFIDILESMKKYSLPLASKRILINTFVSQMPTFDVELTGRAVEALLMFSCPKTLPLTLVKVMEHDKLDELIPRFSTVWMKIINTISFKSDNLGMEILRAIKVLPRTFLSTDLTFKTLISILPIQELQAEALSILTSTISNAYADNLKISESSFMRSVSEYFPDPYVCLITICKESAETGWKVSIQGLVILSFSILSSGSTIMAATPKKRKKHSSKDQLNSFQRSLRSKLQQLANGILTYLFKHSTTSHKEIMDTLVKMLWSVCSSSTHALRYTELLAELVALCPAEMVALLGCLDSVIDSLNLLPADVSVSLVHALLPFVRSGGRSASCPALKQHAALVIGLRDRLLSVLCKAALGSRFQAKFTAVTCFLVLLKHLKVSVDAFRSASQPPSRSSSEHMQQSQISTQANPGILYSQLLSTQVAHQAVLLPCDVDQNQALCTQIVTILQRVMCSAFFSSKPGGPLDNTSSVLKNEIYWGLCEVITRNAGLCEPVLSLYLRMLVSCLSKSFLGQLKPGGLRVDTSLGSAMQEGAVDTSAVIATAVAGPPLRLEDIVREVNVGGEADAATELRYSESPEILVWCLQMLLSQPQFTSAWRRYRNRFSSTSGSRSASHPACNSESTQGSSSSVFSSSTFFSSQQALAFDQSQPALVNFGSVTCGRPVSLHLFHKAATLLLGLSDALRITPLSEFGLPKNTDLTTSPAGKLNRARANVLLGLYDACIEFEMKDFLGPVNSSDMWSVLFVSWSRLHHLFARRLALHSLVFGRAVSAAGASVEDQTNESRPGLLTLRLMSALNMTSLRRVLRKSVGICDQSIIRPDPGAIAGVYEATPLAQYLLQTISTRLACFLKPGEPIPYAYRDTLLQSLLPTLKCVISYYNHLRSILETGSPLSTASHHRSETQQQQNMSSSRISSSRMSSSRMSSSRVSSSRMSTSQRGCLLMPPPCPPALTVLHNGHLFSLTSAALSVLQAGLDLALEKLGERRLHRLACQLYPVASEPGDYAMRWLRGTNRRRRQDGGDADYGDVELEEEDTIDTDDEDDGGANELAVTPPKALSALIKLIKNWIVRLLFPTGSPPCATTATKDVAILLPLLVRLCQARATVGVLPQADGDQPAPCNPLTGLDKVLAWLLRLMRSIGPVGSGGGQPVVAARVQLIGQAVWLARLVGGVPSISRAVQSSEDLSLDSLLANLAGDMRSVLGAASVDQNISRLTTDSSLDLTYPVVTASVATNLLLSLFSSFNRSIDELHWLLEGIAPTLGGRIQPENVTHPGLPTGDNDKKTHNFDRIESEEAICHRLIKLGEATAQLLTAAIPAPGTQADQLLDLARRLFEFMTLLVKYYIRVVRIRGERFPVTFERVIRVFGREVSPNAYAFISYMQSAQSKQLQEVSDTKQTLKKKPVKSGTLQSGSKRVSGQQTFRQSAVSRSIKDSRVIPSFIYSVEQFERFLMQLSKKSKVNLTSSLKLAMSRDFRINQNTLVAQLVPPPAANVSGSDSSDDSEDGMLSYSTPNQQQQGSGRASPPSVPEDVLQAEEAEATPPGEASQAMSHSILDEVGEEVIGLGAGDNDDDKGGIVRTPFWGRAVKPNASRRSAAKRLQSSCQAGDADDSCVEAKATRPVNRTGSTSSSR